MDLVEAAAWTGNRHPWELSRADSFLKLLRARPALGVLADIGSGDSYFLGELARGVDGMIHCVDSGYESSGPRGRIAQHRSIDEISPGSIDTVLMMDVLEHAQDDATLLRKATGLLRLGGTMLITVPAYPALFSEHDKFLGHHRRYTRKRLRALIDTAGLEIKDDFYFFTSLLLGRAGEVLLSKWQRPSKPMTGIGGWPYRADHWVTRCLRNLLNIDFALNRGLRTLGLPSAGLSLCVICQRKSA